MISIFLIKLEMINLDKKMTRVTFINLSYQQVIKR